MSDFAELITPYIRKRAEQDGIDVAVIEAALAKALTTGKLSLTESELRAWYWYQSAANAHRHTKEADTELRAMFSSQAPSVVLLEDESFDEQVARSEDPVVVYLAKYSKVWNSPAYLEPLAQEYRGVLKVCALNLAGNPATNRRFVLDGKGPYLMFFCRRRLMSYRIAKELEGDGGKVAGRKAWIDEQLSKHQRHLQACAKLEVTLAARRAAVSD